jgi:hypothetical protein
MNTISFMVLFRLKHELPEVMYVLFILQEDPDYKFPTKLFSMLPGAKVVSECACEYTIGQQ